MHQMVGGWLARWMTISKIIRDENQSGVPYEQHVAEEYQRDLWRVPEKLIML